MFLVTINHLYNTMNIDTILNELRDKVGRKRFRAAVATMQKQSNLFYDFLDTPQRTNELQKQADDLLSVRDILQQICTENNTSINAVWLLVNATRRNKRNEYKDYPDVVRKDNGREINYGSGNSNRNKIRFPRKCRKTAWKRFNKLFNK